MAANLIARYIWEVNALAKSRQGLTLEELNEQWESCYLYDDRPIVRKTWWEHRQQIALQFGIDIGCDMHTNRYSIKHRDELGRPDFQEWLLDNFAVGYILQQAKDLRSRILFEQVPAGYDYLTKIIQAMRESKVISLTYQGFWQTEAHNLMVAPYCIKAFKQRWYLIARKVKSGDMHTYALDRIQGMAITDDKFALPKDFDAEELFGTVYGIVLDQEEKVERIEINVYNNQAKYFRTLPLHSSQKEIGSDEYCTVFEYRLKPTYDFIQELLLHGPDVEVIHPESLRQIMKRRIQEMAELYE